LPHETTPIDLAGVFSSGTHQEITSAVGAADPDQVRAGLRTHLATALAGRTALRRHLELFDINNNGGLSWNDTFRGFRDVGVDAMRARTITTLSHIVMGFPSSGRWFDWTINLSRLEFALHASNTGLFSERVSDEELQSRLEKLISTYGRDDGRLGSLEFDRIIQADYLRDAGRVTGYRRLIGRSASRMEFSSLLDLAGSEVGGRPRSVGLVDLQDLYGGVLMYALLPPDKLAAAIIRLR
jgi:hypothetical protein